MAWSLEDLAGWLEDTVDTFRGKNRNKPGGEAIYQGAIQPLKMAADVTGVSQGVRGVSPGASPMEKAMGLLAMLSAGTAGAGADDLARAGYLSGQEAVNSISRGIKNRNVYGLHLDPVPLKEMPKKIKAIAEAETRYGPKAESMKNAFFGFGQNPEDIPDRAFESIMKWAQRNWEGTASVVKAPRKGLQRDLRSPVGYKTKKPLKVVKSVQYDLAKGTPEWEYLYPDLEGLVVLDKNLLRKLTGKS